MHITKIIVDLSAWSEHYPTGCILYSYERFVDSEYCDNATEFIEYINKHKSNYTNMTEIRFVFDGNDLNNDSAKECAMEIFEHFNSIKTEGKL